MTALALTFESMTAESMSAEAQLLVDPLRSLAERARDGEAKAFSQLYENTRELAWRALYRVVGPSADLEDLLQESYLQLLKALKSYRGDARTTTFLHRVCVNVGLMHLRSKRRRPEDPTDELPQTVAPASSDPEHQAQLKQAASLAQQALAALSEDKAAVFAYHELLGLKPEEIAELVDCPVNTVRSRLNRARVDFTAEVVRLKGRR